ncbi:MAG: hypothetical protein DRR04_11640 [Gammaproteobacteria bacterium]|nr:MAG: hypothetical protein DRR04_11640 [Gammaproteobacteria bacterium]
MPEETQTAAPEPTHEQSVDASVEASIDPSIDAAGQNPMDEAAPAEAAPEAAPVSADPPVVEGRGAEVERAIESLRMRGSAPEGVFEGMSDEAILGWSEKVDSKQVEIDRAFIGRGEASKRVAELEESLKSAQATPQSTEPATPTVPVVDLSETIEPLVELFGGDDDVRKVLSNSFNGVLTQANQRAAQAEAQVQQLAVLVEGQLLGSARASLAGVYPALADGEYYGKVTKTMRQLEEVGRHSEIEDPVARIQSLMESALKLEAPPETAPPVDPAIEAAKRNGSPVIPTPSKERSRSDVKLEGEALVDKKIQFIQNNPNASSADVRRHFGSR